jgi:putative redox protein
VDVVKILQKQRQQITSLKIEVDGEREEGKEPSLWKEVRLRFILDGNVDPAKAFRAAELSMNKYCSVAETLRRAGASIQFVVEVNGSVYNPQ